MGMLVPPLTRRGLLSATAAGPVLALATACQPGAQRPPEQRPAPASPVTLEFWEWGYSPAWISVHEQLFERYKAQQRSHVSVSIVPIDNAAKVLAAVAGGVPPDLLRMPSQLTEFAERGILLALDRHIGDLDLKQDFFPGAWAAGQWKGQTYGVVDNFFSWVWAYNAAVLREHGFPAFPDTLEEFLAVGQAVSGPGKGPGGKERYFVQVGVHLWAIQPFLYTFGGGVLNQDRTRVILAEEPSLAAIQYLYDLRYRYRVCAPWPNPPEVSLDNGTQVALGVGAYVIAGPKPGWERAFAPFPKRTKETPRVTVANGGTFEVVKDGKHIDETVRLLRWLVSMPVRLDRCKALQIEPYFKAGLSDPFYRCNPEWQAFLESVPVARPEPLIPAWGKLNELAVEYIGRIMQNELGVREGLTAAAREMQMALEQPLQ